VGLSHNHRGKAYYAGSLVQRRFAFVVAASIRTAVLTGLPLLAIHHF
jgi:hypothetical protein